MRIKIPRLSTSNAIDFCRHLSLSEFADTYYFDVSDINNYEPLPMLLTASAIRQFCQARDLSPWDIQLRYTENADFHYACHMAYFQAAGFPEGKAPGEAPGSATYIPLTKINIVDLQQKAIENGTFLEQGDIIEEKSKELAQILAQSNAELKKLLQFLIREAIRNIPEHADTNDVWLCGQYWHNRNLAEIAILDEGIGIYESLRRNRIHKEYITSKGEALEWAIKPGVSSKFTPTRAQRSGSAWTNSGFGLYMISEICKATGGWLTLVSDSKCMRVYSNNKQLIDTDFHGTALGIRIKTDGITNAQQLISQMNKKGTEEARTIKSAFKESSVPSKGLMR